MKYKHIWALLVVPLLAPACSQWMRETCSPSGPCMSTLSQPMLWISTSAATVLMLLSTTLVAWLLRTAWLVVSTARDVHRLPLTAWPLELQEAVERTGARHVRCWLAKTPLAFCAGGVHPAIFVTDGLVEHLRSSELDAVLVHEMHHSRRRDPLRCAMRRAASDVCFYVPLFGWWAQHQHENAELCADRATLRQVGLRPLAGALWALDSASLPKGLTGFTGAAELRAAQVLGDELPRRYPEASLWLASAVGLSAALEVTWCLAPMLLALL